MLLGFPVLGTLCMRRFSFYLIPPLLVAVACRSGPPDVPSPRSGLAVPPVPSAMAKRLEVEIQRLEAALDGMMDEKPDIVIDTVHNRLQVWHRNRLVEEAVCATGSGKILLSDNRKSWRFNTPKGQFEIRRKVVNPIWKKPEWAFVEAGLEAPVLPWDFRRLDPVTLGRFALDLGDGYEIHGNLYPNLIGRNITHGCIRLNDGDLESTFALAQNGSRVYIY